MIMVSKDKAYIVNNKEQELRVLTKLEQKGYIWVGSSNDKPTEYIPSEYFIISEHFPIAITSDLNKRLSADSSYEYLNDEHYNIVYDGRLEKTTSPKVKISKEVYDALNGWLQGRDLDTEPIRGWDMFQLPQKVDDWIMDVMTTTENNNRLIAIIRWVNGEDVFEVEKPKKWVVRSKITDEDENYWYARVHNEYEISSGTPNLFEATKFDTKEEAESWANAHQEVIDVDK